MGINPIIIGEKIMTIQIEISESNLAEIIEVLEQACIQVYGETYHDLVCRDFDCKEVRALNKLRLSLRY